jgi:hypothetical protein
MARHQAVHERLPHLPRMPLTLASIRQGTPSCEQVGSCADSGALCMGAAPKHVPAQRSQFQLRALHLSITWCPRETGEAPSCGGVNATT